MKKGFLSIALLVIATNLSSQVTKIGFQSGFYFSSMEQLRHFNQIYLESLPFDSKIVSDFPEYWYFKPFISQEYTNFSLGFSWFYTSTGSRTSAKDFSGEYKLDMKIHTNAPAIFADIHINSDTKLNVGFRSSIGLLISELNIHEILMVADKSLIWDENNFKSINFFYLPELRVSYPLSFIGFEIYAGYLIQYGGRAFSLAGNKNAFLANPDTNNPVEPNWNGAEIGFSITCSLNWQHHKKQQ